MYSQSKIAIVLNQNLECGKICQKIQNLIQKYIEETKEDPSSLLLSISIKTITEDNPKKLLIEHKEISKDENS